MKIGDLVKVPLCPDNGLDCGCFFCNGNSNGIGLVMAPAELNMWHVMFDVGEWEVYEREVEVVN
jgi:hypothetical protein